MTKNIPSSSLDPFFSPRGIALIGASTDPSKLGYGLARNLVQCNFQGVIHFVNPKGGSLLGRPMHPSVLVVPDPVDLAIVLIPAAGVAEVLKECAIRGIHAAIVASGGFRETGMLGAELEAELMKIADHYRIRLLGPTASVCLIPTFRWMLPSCHLLDHLKVMLHLFHIPEPSVLQLSIGRGVRVLVSLVWSVWGIKWM